AVSIGKMTSYVKRKSQIGSGKLLWGRASRSGAAIPPHLQPKPPAALLLCSPYDLSHGYLCRLELNCPRPKELEGQGGFERNLQLSPKRGERFTKSACNVYPRSIYFDVRSQHE